MEKVRRQGKVQFSNTWHTAACADDIRHLYRVFLGRECEVPSAHDRRIGLPFDAVLCSVVESKEFRSAFYDLAMSGRQLPARWSASRPGPVVRRWVADRLLLGSQTGRRAFRAKGWNDLRAVIFADPALWRAAGDTGALLQHLSTAPMSFDAQYALIEQSSLFERDWYLDAYPNVAASRGDPLAHYILHGVAEGRNPNRLFDNRWYLAAHPDARTARMTPLTHYIVKGARLGLAPHPFCPAVAPHLTAHSRTTSTRTPLGDYLGRVLPFDPASFPRFGPYDVFKATDDLIREEARAELERHFALMMHRPRFIVLIADGDEAAIALTRSSLASQLYDNFQVVSTRDEVLDVARRHSKYGGFLLWLDAGDELKPLSLYDAADVFNRDPQIDALYFDHDVMGPDGTRWPAHKPDWSPDHLEAFDYIGSSCFFELKRAALLLEEAESRYDFLLAFAEQRSRFVHSTRVLLSAAGPATSQAAEARRRDEICALVRRLFRTGREGVVEETRADSFTYNVSLKRSRTPLVSILIPTAAKTILSGGRRIDLIVECLASVLGTSTYREVEFIVIDNGDFDRAKLGHLPIEKIVFATYDLQDVNIAKKINLAAGLASGSVYLILNDDVKPISVDWIERMLDHLEKPHVGVVGAKLLYPDETIQHAGIVMCDGAPQHVRRGKPRSESGYRFSTSVARNYLAVTGAVSMTPSRTFWQVGGYSEEFPIDYNDVDFCLKLFDAGYSCVYEPRAELYHYESASIVKPPRPLDVERFASRWAHIVDDPFYNQYAFTKHPATYELSYSGRRA